MIGCAVIGGLVAAYIMVFLLGSRKPEIYPLCKSPNCRGVLAGEFCLGRKKKGIDLVMPEEEFAPRGSFQLQPRGPGIFELWFKHYRSETMLQVAKGKESDIRELKQELNNTLYSRSPKGEANKN